MSVKRIIACVGILLGLLVSAAGAASATTPSSHKPVLSALAPGTYTLTATPIDGMHGVGNSRSVRLKVLPT